MKIFLVVYDEIAYSKKFINVLILFFMLIPCISLSLFSALNVDPKKPTSDVQLQKLTYDFIKPPDHLKAVKMERDGHLNRDFRQEILLGNILKNGTEDEKLLISVHKKADMNNDGYLNLDELETWMIQKVKEHFQTAVRDNYLIFTSLDKDHNGRVTWNEYHINFMIQQGFNKTYASKHPENHRHLKRKVQEKILLDRAAWSEAANSDPEALNIDEFMTFRHPEHSHVSLINMVNDIINSLDNDGDEILTEDEFADMPSDNEENQSLAEWKMQRRKEFRDNIDMNRDGKVTREELLMYNDPENPVHSRNEARKLIRIADVNKDELLSLSEVLAKKESFLGSKMVDTARSFHDEF